MKNGFTTGSCAAAAAKAAALMLFEETEIKRVEIMTPAGVEYTAEVWDIKKGTETDSGAPFVSCAVRKYSGDDPDITNNMLIYARVIRAETGIRPIPAHTPDAHPGKSVFGQSYGEGRVYIEGGTGIGKVTRPGLDRKVGEAAINTVPRRMIEQEIRAVTEEYEYRGDIKVIISAPEGERIAAKTFNPKLGIEGGISIIGTTGIVEPMSTKAILDTIKVELNQLLATGEKTAIVSPGNYGLDFMKARYGYDLDRAVKCSNYIGETIDMACSMGFESLLLTGHVGKLIKLSGGIMNTHSKEGDCRMELMAASAVRAGADRDTVILILDSLSTEEAYQHMIDHNIEKECFSYIMEKISYYLQKRAVSMKTECIVYSNKYGLLGATPHAEELLYARREA